MGIVESREWWVNDLPKEQEDLFAAYLDSYPQYQQEDETNPVPFPEVVSPDTVTWLKPDDGKWVNYSAEKHGLITALRSKWLPEEPVAVEEEVAEESVHECPKCEYTSKSSVGLKIHMSLLGHK